MYTGFCSQSPLYWSNVICPTLILGRDRGKDMRDVDKEEGSNDEGVKRNNDEKEASIRDLLHLPNIVCCTVL